MRILLIEDETKLAKSLKKALETESYAVDLALDGKTGYDMAFGEEYDLIILDLGLPTMSGLEIAKQVRGEKVNTPILMLTARDTLKDKIQGLNTGADDYLVKPFEFEELLARIRALLRRGQKEPETVYQIDNLTLDPVAKTVKRAGKEITLSAKEYALLEYLLVNHGQIISKEQLIDHVWDMELDPFSKVIDVYIGYVRNKVDKAFPQEKPLIHTIKGMGYKIS